MTERTYKIIRSKRKTIGIVVDQNGDVEVRIPYWATVAQADEFVKEKSEWIEKTKHRLIERREKSEAHDWDSVKAETYPWIEGMGGKLFTDKVKSWADRMGVTYNHVSIKDVSSRWGSCSGKGNINFSWKVFVMPERLVDYIIVHELAHRKFMNHSEMFWNEVAGYIPDYKNRRKELNNYL